MASPESQLSRKTLREILIVEDEAISYKYLHSLLKEKGFLMYQAVNAEETMQVLKINEAINLILLDIHLPGVDGFEIAEKIKQWNPDIVIIGQSAHSFIVSETDKRSELFDDFIAKPIIKGTLFRKLSNFFNNFA